MSEVTEDPIEEAVIEESAESVEDQIEALLSPVDEEEIKPEKAEAEEPQETEEPDNEDDEEVEEDGIDYELSVPFPDGRDAMTVGEMKDAINDVERTKQGVETQRIELIKQETELNNYLQQAGIAIPPEFQQHMAQRQEQYLNGQHELMLKMMPEMSDKTAFADMRKGIVSAAQGSNFTEQEIAQIGDARVVHALHRLAVLEAKQLKAQETVKQLKAKPKLKSVQRRNASKSSKTDRQYNQALKGSRADKDAMIDSLLSG